MFTFYTLFKESFCIKKGSNTLRITAFKLTQHNYLSNQDSGLGFHLNLFAM